MLICSLGQKALIKEKLYLARQLWSSSIKCDIFQDLSKGQEEIQDYAKRAGVQHMIILKDAEPDTARVRTLDKDKQTEKKFYNISSSIPALLDHLKAASCCR